MRYLTIATLLFTTLCVIGCVEPDSSPQIDPFAEEIDSGCDSPACTPQCPDGKCPNFAPSTAYGLEVGSSDAGMLVNTQAAGEVKQKCLGGNCGVGQSSRAAQTSRFAQTRTPARYYLQSTTSGVRHDGPPIALNPGEVLMSVGALRVLPRPPMQSNAAPDMPKPDPQPAVTTPCPDGKCPLEQKQETREGVFACQHCGKRAVGAEWHEVWADDDTPLTCLCESCWAAMTPHQRSAELTRYAREQARGAIDPIVKDAIREASTK